MQSANLNYIQTRKYLGFMTNCGYISVTQKETYVITAEGSKYLQMIQIQELTRMR
jgi:predicted transcriptional regulator